VRLHINIKLRADALGQWFTIRGSRGCLERVANFK